MEDRPSLRRWVRALLSIPLSIFASLHYRNISGVNLAGVVGACLHSYRQRDRRNVLTTLEDAYMAELVRQPRMEIAADNLLACVVIGMS